MSKATIMRDFSQVFRNLDGSPVRTGITQETAVRAIELALAKVPADQREGVKKAIEALIAEPLTLGAAAGTALINAMSGEERKHLEPQEASRRWVLAMEIYKGGRIEISTDQREMIKQRIAMGYPGALIAGQAHDMLETDPASTPE